MTQSFIHRNETEIYDVPLKNFLPTVGVLSVDEGTDDILINHEDFFEIKMYQVSNGTGVEIPTAYCMAVVDEWEIGDQEKE